jgi:hypothetical protein
MAELKVRMILRRTLSSPSPPLEERAGERRPRETLRRSGFALRKLSSRLRATVLESGKVTRASSPCPSPPEEEREICRAAATFFVSQTVLPGTVRFPGALATLAPKP